MVTEFFLDIIFRIVSGLLSRLPDFSWTVETSAFEYLRSFIRCIGYLLPWNTVTAIAAAIVVLIIIRIVIAFVMAIWELLPLV